MPPPLENKNAIDVAKTFNVKKGLSNSARRNGQHHSKRIGNKKKCRGCCRGFAAMLFSHAGLCALVVGYSIAGAFAFGALEGPREEKGAQRVRLLRRDTVRRLWEITEGLNVLYRDNWTGLVEQEVRRFQQELVRALREGGAAYDMNAGGTAFADEQDLHHYQKRRQWSFCGAFLYSLTVITTVGYGNIAPRTDWGKLVTVVYAIFGIPLMFLYLTNVGNLLARAFKCIYGRICHASGARRNRGHHQVANSRNKQREIEQYQIHHIMLQDAASPAATLANNAQNSIDSSTLMRNKLNASSDLMKTSSNDDDDDDDDPLDDSDVMHHTSGPGQRRSRARVTVPVTLCLIIVGSYICGGAALFSAWEGWDYLDGAYFCFVTLSTIGFGDLVPGDGLLTNIGDEEANQEKLVMCSLYLLAGMAIIAMCFNLVQEEVVYKLRGVGRSIGLIHDSREADD